MHQPLVLWSINFFMYEDSSRHRRGPWWPWTNRWRYPNERLLWL